MDTCNEPLFVDLDGTFTKTDLLFEGAFNIIKSNPFMIMAMLFWLVKGRSYLKYKIASHSNVDVALLPLNPEFESFVRSESTRGRKIYLATATNEKYAERIIKKHDIFDGFIASDRNINLKGKEKLKKILDISEKFAYAGNDAVDFKIFKESSQSILVNPTRSALKLSKKNRVDKTFDNTKFSLSVWMKQLRIHQWLKNALIFVPLVVSGLFTDINSVGLSVIAFFSFSFLASSTYILNDLVDLDSDRSHPRKSKRPLAAGSISIPQSIIVGSTLLLSAFFMGVMIGPMYLLVLTGYLLLTLFYSMKLKEYIGMDVVALAMLYTVRILAGSAAIDVVVSFWLFAFSIFIFLSLALVKRCSELRSMALEGKVYAKGRDYGVDDYELLKSFGSSSSLVAVLMFCFYINNNVLTNQYQEPSLLWLITPALCYWLMRMWIKTHRGEMHDDPIVFALKDKGSIVIITFCLFIFILAQLL